MKKIAILGATGSIGRQVLDVVRRLPEHLSVVALAANTNLNELVHQARAFGVRSLGLLNPSKAYLNGASLDGLSIKEGIEGLCELVRHPEVDLVIVAVAGMIGLQPTLVALDAGKPVALSTKEVLVAGGELVMAKARQRQVPLIPVDSEHSAIFQCLRGEQAEYVEKIILTASGGPFANRPLDEMRSVTVEEALQHPNWRMGDKITIDSATMMNKGLEVIEAHWLFGLAYDQIEVAIHPQSIIHSIVAFQDGSWLAQMGVPDMRVPIQYALLYPERANTHLPRLSVAQMSHLTFYEPDPVRFPCLELAYSAARCGGTMPAVLNAANEVAVQLFLQGRIGFTDIPELVRTALTDHQPVDADLENILKADRQAREQIQSVAGMQAEEILA
jgi:1-deoxy-D-xylulose-5-phosphate reductoisomerase